MTTVVQEMRMRCTVYLSLEGPQVMKFESSPLIWPNVFESLVTVLTDFTVQSC